MNKSVCSGLGSQLKGSIKECFRGFTMLGRKFGSWCTEKSDSAKKKIFWRPRWPGSICMQMTLFSR